MSSLKNSWAMLSMAMLVMMLLAGCGGRQLVRDDATQLPSESQAHAKREVDELRRVAAITQHISTHAVHLCKHRMPRLDFVAHAMPTDGISNEDAQAVMRYSELDADARVVVSWNPQIPVGAKIQRVAERDIKPTIPGWDVQRALTYEGAGSDAITVVVDGTAHTYSGSDACAAVVLQRLERQPKPYNMSYPSERFIISLVPNQKRELGERSEQELAFLVALQMAAGAGGKFDSAMSARNVLLATSIIPGVDLIGKLVGRAWMASRIDWSEIDALAIAMLTASGYSPSLGVEEFLRRCGSECSKAWTEERKKPWMATPKMSVTPLAQSATE